MQHGTLIDLAVAHFAGDKRRAASGSRARRLYATRRVCLLQILFGSTDVVVGSKVAVKGALIRAGGLQPQNPTRVPRPSQRTATDPEDVEMTITMVRNQESA